MGATPAVRADVFDPNGNAGLQSLAWTTNDGDGEISFVANSRYGFNAHEFPPTDGGGLANRYAVGTFAFQPRQGFQISSLQRRF